LSHYCEESKRDKSYKTWDYNLEEDNLEDGVLVLEQLENALIDDDDCGDMPIPSIDTVPLIRTLVARVGGFMFSSTSIYTINPCFRSTTTTWRLMGQSWWCKEEGKVDRN
jgi:hypothetical protein